MILAQGMDVLAPEVTKVAARKMDELRPIYDAACKKHKITNEALSGRECQMALYYRTEPSELPVLMEYLLDKGVPVRHIITYIKGATPELRQYSLSLCIAQHEAYERQQQARAVNVMA